MIAIELYKTKIELSSYIATIGDEITVTITATDYNDKPLSNKIIDISASNNGYFHTHNNTTISGTSTTQWGGTTDSNGQLTLTFIPTSNGTTVFSTRDTSVNLIVRDYYTQDEIDSKINDLTDGINLKAQMLNIDNWTSGLSSITDGTITFNDSGEFINDVNNNSVVAPHTFRLEFDVIFDDDYSDGDFIVCSCSNDFYATDTPHHFIIDIENNNGTVQCIESENNWTISNLTQVLESDPFIMINTTPQQDGIQITNIKYSANNIQTLYKNQKNTSPINVVVTYTDSTTETIKLLRIME